MNSYRNAMLAMQREAKREFLYHYRALPNQARSLEQELLKSKHGTPREFAKALADALGEVTVVEAQEAVAKYLKEWEEAK